MRLDKTIAATLSAMRYTLYAIRYTDVTELAKHLFLNIRIAFTTISDTPQVSLSATLRVPECFKHYVGKTWFAIIIPHPLHTYTSFIYSVVQFIQPGYVEYSRCNVARVESILHTSDILMWYSWL